jgi:hypothetical protein
MNRDPKAVIENFLGLRYLAIFSSMIILYYIILYYINHFAQSINSDRP